MRKLYATFLLLFLSCCAYSQGFSLNDLINYTSYTPSRFENSISKRGYRMDGFNSMAEGRAYTWHAKKAKVEPVEKTIFKSDKEDKAIIAFQTTAADEFNNLRAQLDKEGYRYDSNAKT